MPKLLKLQNVKSFSCPAFNGHLVHKKDVIRVPDALADKLEMGGRVNAENEFVPYWVEPSADEEKNVLYDFTKPKGDEKNTELAATSAPAAGSRVGARKRVPQRK